VLIDRKPKHKHLPLNEDKFDSIGNWLKHSTLEGLIQETGALKGTEESATRLLKP
jgi:hypothetical protein